MKRKKILCTGGAIICVVAFSLKYFFGMKNRNPASSYIHSISWDLPSSSVITDSDIMQFRKEGIKLIATSIAKEIEKEGSSILTASEEKEFKEEGVKLIAVSVEKEFEKDNVEFYTFSIEKEIVKGPYATWNELRDQTTYTYSVDETINRGQKILTNISYGPLKLLGFMTADNLYSGLSKVYTNKKEDEDSVQPDVESESEINNDEDTVTVQKFPETKDEDVTNINNEYWNNLLDGLTPEKEREVKIFIGDQMINLTKDQFKVKVPIIHDRDRLPQGGIVVNKENGYKFGIRKLPELQKGTLRFSLMILNEKNQIVIQSTINKSSTKALRDIISSYWHTEKNRIDAFIARFTHPDKLFRREDIFDHLLDPEKSNQEKTIHEDMFAGTIRSFDTDDVGFWHEYYMRYEYETRTK